jgi:hypothetical protein
VKEYFLDHKDSMRKAFKAYLKGLDEAAQYFVDSSLEHVRKGLDMTKEASEIILEYQKGLVKAGEGPQNKLCFKCGKENEITMRFCTFCNATFPAFEGSVPSGMELRMDREGNVGDGSHADTDFSRSLSFSVASVKDGSLTKERFLKILDETENKILMARKDKEKLGSVRDMGIEQEAQEVLDELDETMMAGFSEISEGLEQMRRYGESGEESHLTFGLESALSGADRLVRVQALTNQMKNPGAPL